MLLRIICMPALGHGIADADTGLLVDISAGGLYKADVSTVIPSKKGSPDKYQEAWNCLTDAVWEAS